MFHAAQAAPPHTLFEDVQALVTAALFVALGVAMYAHAGLLTGGTAGIAFLIHYAGGWRFGTLFFLIPTCVVGGWLTFWFFWDSWVTGEQAANAVGLPRWPAKLMFPLGFALLLLQAISELIKRFEALSGHRAFDTSYEKPVQ